MEEQVYKLTLNLNLATYPPIPKEQCLLCGDTIESVNYDLVVLSPVDKIFHFDENCFNQVIAVGIKLFQNLADSNEKVAN